MEPAQFFVLAFIFALKTFTNKNLSIESFLFNVKYYSFKSFTLRKQRNAALPLMNLWFITHFNLRLPLTIFLR